MEKEMKQYKVEMQKCLGESTRITSCEEVIRPRGISTLAVNSSWNKNNTVIYSATIFADNEKEAAEIAMTVGSAVEKVS
jgi:hypothetical protein